MSDTPSPTPAPDALKPKLSLSPKAPAAPAPAETPAAPAPAHAMTPTVASAHVTPGILQTGSSAAPVLVSSGAARQSFKLQGAASIHPANGDKVEPPKFTSPMPAASEGPSIVVVALSAIAAAAAITFAALLFLKTQ